MLGAIAFQSVYSELCKEINNTHIYFGSCTTFICDCWYAFRKAERNLPNTRNLSVETFFFLEESFGRGSAILGEEGRKVIYY